MKKLEKQNSPEITTEAKLEIQELFDELFVGNLNSEIIKATSKSTETSEEISNLKKLSKDYFSVLSDQMESIEESLVCLGDKDAWGNDTIITFLNVLAKKISECKSIVEERTKCLSSEWKDVLLEEYLVRSEIQNNDILNTIKGIHEENIGNKVEKLYNEIKQIDGIMGKLSIIETTIDSILSNFGHEGTIENITSVQNDIKSEISEISASLKCVLDDLAKSQTIITGKLETSENKVIQVVQSLDGINQKINNQAQIINEGFDEYKKITDLRFKYLASGIAISLVFNIVLTIMIIIK